MSPLVLVLDIGHRVAGIPGSGDTPVVVTTTTDVGKFVVASLALEKWSETSFVVGDRKSFNDILAISEKVTGMVLKLLSFNIVLVRRDLTSLTSRIQI